MNEELATTLDDAVAEVYTSLTGSDLSLVPELNTYQAITRALNKALRLNATDNEWSYYASTESGGLANQGDRKIDLRPNVRPRIMNGDAVRLVNESGRTLVWAAFLPRAELHKYPVQSGLWVSIVGQTLEFSRPLLAAEANLEILIPVMREPTMFRLPVQPEDVAEPLVEVPQDVREQLVDFAYPDVIIGRATYLYAQSNALWQPRVQTLEAIYKDLFYSLKERDDRNNDAPYMNEWFMPMEGDITGQSNWTGRPTADPFVHRGF